jgi:hypothetical protein
MAQRASERRNTVPVERLELDQSFSFRFGECNGWLACRFCGTWHIGMGDEFTPMNRRRPMAERSCTRWAHGPSRAERITAGLAPLMPSEEACRAHAKNLTKKRNTAALRRSGASRQSWS